MSPVYAQTNAKCMLSHSTKRASNEGLPPLLVRDKGTKQNMWPLFLLLLLNYHKLASKPPTYLLTVLEVPSSTSVSLGSQRRCWQVWFLLGVLRGGELNSLHLFQLLVAAVFCGLRAPSPFFRKHHPYPQQAPSHPSL